MAVTYGFYNALNHDRLYDAIQMSSIFDGIIQDGIFSTIGTSMIVTAPEDGMFVDVGPGRAWFNHTWTLNDTEYPVEAEEAEVVLDRIDAVILEVNSAAEVRANSIKFLKGTPSSNPVKPTLTHNAEVNQYALAYVTIRAGQTTIFQSDVENVVGTDETPFVTGLLQQVSVEQLLLQWNDDFYRYFAAFQSHSTAEFTTWMDAKVTEYNEWYASMEAEGAHDLETFDTWFQHMKDQLDEDAAGHLQAEIDELAEACEKGSVFTVSTEEPELVGRSCVVSQGSDTITKQFNSSGVAEFPSMPYIGSIHVEATDGDNVAQGDMNIPYFGRYNMEIAFWAATLNISTSADGLIERPITITKGGVVVGTTSFNASGRATYKVHEPGTYIVSSSTAGGDEYAATVVVTEETAYPVNLGIPSGATATPTDDIQIWLKCASIYDKSYTLLADVLEDYYTCERLFSDSNACDYMARSSSWAAIVTTDGSVMEQIGKYDYCCNKLLNNETWAAVIVASDYADYILTYEHGLVPVMTSATTPSGVVSASRSYDATYAEWHAFDGGANFQGWVCDASYVQRAGDWLEYQFTQPQQINTIKIGYRVTTALHDVYFKVQAHDGNDWVDLSAELWLATTTLQALNTNAFIITSPTEYSRYRIYITRNGANAGGHGIKLQFYGEKPAPATDLIHSAAYDTIYYYDANNVERQLCVTDENGNGTVDWSEMEPGIYTFYSTVAKNPDNLSEEYSKTVKITKTTTEVYLMPPNALYWNGYEDGNLEDMTTANGWAAAGFTSYAIPTRNAYDISFSGTNNSTITGICSKIVDKFTKGHTIYNGSAAYENAYGGLAKSPVKQNFNNNMEVGYINSRAYNTDFHFAHPFSGNDGYAILMAFSGMAGKTKAFWKLDSRSITVHSAANDTIYYLGENNVHIPFAKTDEAGSASVDLGLIPQGTYTLYSSVAKDPDNLSNPYSKTVTIGPDTKSIKVMPDGALYWYGWKSENLEDCSTANGWTGYNNGSWTAPAYNANSVRLSGAVNAGNAGFGSKVTITTRRIHGIVQRVSNPVYSGIQVRSSKDLRNSANILLAASQGLNTTVLTHVYSDESQTDLTGNFFAWDYNGGVSDWYALWAEYDL